MSLIIIAPSNLPIPSVRGGAIETGIQQIIDENELEHKTDIIVYSYYEPYAKEVSKKYKYTKFVYYKSNIFAKLYKNIARMCNYMLKSVKAKRRFNIHSRYLKYIIKDLKNCNLTNKDVILIKNAVNYVIPIYNNLPAKIFLQLHNDFFNKDTYKASKIAQCCEGLIANSEYIKKCILTIDKIEDKKVMINKNCLDNNDFEDISAKDVEKKAIEYGIDLRKKNILFSGRIVPQKGIKELIYSAQDISKDIDWNLNIIGSKSFGKNTTDKFKKELYNIADKNKDRIKFLGYVKHSDVKFLNKVADVVVIPSIWEEPAGRVALEAQVVGTPIIISNSGGLGEYTNDKASIVIERGENFIKDLTKMLEKILLDDDLRKAMGEEAKKVTSKYTSKNYYNEILTQLGLI